MSLLPPLCGLVADLAPQLGVGATGIDPTRLLAALAMVESSGGRDLGPRYEPAYAQGGVYWRRAAHVQQAWREWGAYAACSYGPWQILYIVCAELGYGGDPAALRPLPATGPWVVRKLNAILGQGASSVRAVADAWNSGSFADALVPEVYIAKVEAAYREPALLQAAAPGT